MLKLVIVQTVEVDAETRSDIVALCVAAHNESDFEHLFTYLPEDGRHFLAYQAGTLVSHAVVTTRWLQLDSGPALKTAYVDAVSTLPENQGQGHGSAVMRHLAAHLDGFELACLETDRPVFYARLGWELWQGALAGRKESELITTTDQDSIMILRTVETPPLDCTGLLVVQYDGRFW